MGLRQQRAQATVEWIGVLGVVSAMMVTSALLVISDYGSPGKILKSIIEQRILCAIKLSNACKKDTQMEAAYGKDIAEKLRLYAPELVSEAGTKALPVDFRDCHMPSCGDGNPYSYTATHTRTGLPVTYFTRAIDRRKKGGDLYLQYWFYYADSLSTPSNGGVKHGLKYGSIGARKIPFSDKIPLIKQARGIYHKDDWESYQVRIRADGLVLARSSAHERYRGRQDPGADKWRNSSGWDVLGKQPPGWVESTAWYRVSRDSHAGHIPRGYTKERHTPSIAARLVPLETLSEKARTMRTFDSGAPPWNKCAYKNPNTAVTGGKCSSREKCPAGSVRKIPSPDSGAPAFTYQCLSVDRSKFSPRGPVYVPR